MRSVRRCDARWLTSSKLNGLAALGISALPESRAKTVWYDANGHCLPT